MSEYPYPRRQYDCLVCLRRGDRRAIMALLSSRFSLKSVMLFLAGLCILGNTLFTFSSSYAMLALGRLVSGFPHGAFFGVARLSCRKSRRRGR